MTYLLPFDHFSDLKRKFYAIDEFVAKQYKDKQEKAAKYGIKPYKLKNKGVAFDIDDFKDVDIGDFMKPFKKEKEEFFNQLGIIKSN